MNDEYDDLYGSQSRSWVCPLCSAENVKDEKTCRFCRLPSRNECKKSRHIVGKRDHFCKYCGSATVYFESAVFDPQERALARKACKATFSYWRKQGVRYLNIEDEYEYSQQLIRYGEIID